MTATVRTPFPPAPRSLGDGWLTRNAADLAKIAVAFGGYDEEELVRRLAFIRPGSAALLNAATVGRVLAEMYDEAHPEAEADRAAAVATIKEEAQR